MLPPKNRPKVQTMAITKRGQHYNDILSDDSYDSLERPQNMGNPGLFQPMSVADNHEQSSTAFGARKPIV